MEHEYEIRQEGRKEGEAIKIIDIIKRMFSKGMSIEVITDMLEQDKEYIQNILNLLSEHPELSTIEIANLLIENTN